MHKVTILGKECIFVGHGLTSFIALTLTTLQASTFIIITDTNVAPLHLSALLSALSLSLPPSTSLLSYSINAGEVFKTRKTKEDVEDYMLKNGCTRDSVVIALGGGVVGDLSGYVASTYMRGIPVVQIPTTLLAMVDSSIGGKTGVDTPAGKNLVGSFWQPTFVFVDVEYLRTLDARQFRNGMAEVVKTAAMWDVAQFEVLEKGCVDILLGLEGEGLRVLTEVILASIQVKAYVVSMDEREGGLRGLLNFGHTVGHAIETLVYPDLLHGECVAIGMVKEAEVSRRLGHLDDMALGRLVRILKAYGLPVSMEDKLYTERTKVVCSLDRLMDVMKVDKKNVGKRKKMVLLSRIGNTLVKEASFVDDHDIEIVLAPALLIQPFTSYPLKAVRLAVPGSKSISNRALVMASLGQGDCELRGLLHSDDVQVMLVALQSFLPNLTYKWTSTSLHISKAQAVQSSTLDRQVYLGNAGTASRFLTSVALLLPFVTTLTGNARMHERPIKPLIDTLRANGADISYLGLEGSLPVKVQGGRLKGGQMRLDGSVSSQYVSSILMVAPYADEEVLLTLDGLVSASYVEMSCKMMSAFGVHVQRENGAYRVQKGGFVNPSVYVIEGDASSATYPLAWSALTGVPVTITNLGKDSIQGDSSFSKLILEPMGCSVQVTDNETSVSGTVSKGLGVIDMESMTDAFMTVAVLASCVEGYTKIEGVANQRVKECDRLAVMESNLTNLNIKCNATSDGLYLNGHTTEQKVSKNEQNVSTNVSTNVSKNEQNISTNELKEEKVVIECHDDHRIAMSFSVLGSVRKGVVIDEKKCVEKTWPSWWDCLSRTLMTNLSPLSTIPLKSLPLKSLPLTSIPLSLPSSSISSSSIPLSLPLNMSKSVLLVGMRGVGKTTLGRLLGVYLNRPFIDLDELLEQTHGPIPTLIASHGWPHFRHLERQILAQTLHTHATGTVMSTGGGVVELAENRAEMQRWAGLVVWVHRSLDGVDLYKQGDRPMYGVDMKECYRKREPLYMQVSAFCFFSHDIHAFGPFISSILLSSPVPKKETITGIEPVTYVPLGTPKEKEEEGFEPVTVRDEEEEEEKKSYFLSLTCKDVREVQEEMTELSLGVSALELRVDLLANQSIEYIMEQVFLLRSYTALPLIYTVRTAEQGGQYKGQALLALLELGLMLNCEFVDSEVDISEYRRSKTTLLIASHHNLIDSSLMEEKCEELEKWGDIVKVIGTAKSFRDTLIFESATRAKLLDKSKPKKLISILMGQEGKLTRCLNAFMTPITHAKIVSAAKGQVTINQIHATLADLNILKPRQYALFGSDIKRSLSPLLHNTSFIKLSLPYSYKLEEHDSIKGVLSVMNKYKGASVTIPFKVDIMPFCVDVDLHARLIGAVNTLVKVKGGVKGYNTDYIGIRNSITPYLTKNHTKVTAIVIGGGGTARAAIYALDQMDQIAHIRLWCRNSSKAAILAKELRSTKIQVYEKLEDIKIFDGYGVVVGTIPSHAQQSMDWQGWFEGEGVVVDMAYTPKQTIMLQKASLVGSWSVVTGVEVLVEQGLEQFKIWTDLDAWSGVRDVVLNAY